MLKRKRQKLSKESDVRKISELEQMRVMTNDGKIIPVKRESVSSTSPNPYMLGAPQQMAKLSPIYASRTPSPLDPYQQSYGMQGAAAVYPATSSTVGPVYTPYHISLDHQEPQSHQQLLSDSTNILNMDTNEFSVELNLNRLDSRDLAELSILDDGTLSNSLSASLILGEQNQPVTSSTDSLTKLATSTYNDLCYQ